METTRTRALAAAVELLGTEGLRALTHARVDERAGLPKGSTSNWFRTRASLLSGVVDWIVEQELPGVDQATVVPASAEELVGAVADLIDLTTGPGRTLTTARLILFLEASHDESLRERLSRGRLRIEATVVSALERLGSSDAAAGAAALMAVAEGIILHRIARDDRTDPRPALERVVRAALS